MFTTNSLTRAEKSDSNDCRGTERPLTKIDLRMKFLSKNSALLPGKKAFTRTPEERLSKDYPIHHTLFCRFDIDFSKVFGTER